MKSSKKHAIWALSLAGILGFFVGEYGGISPARASKNLEVDKEQVQKPVRVQSSMSFSASKVKELEVSTDRNLKLKFSKADGDQVIVSLLGEGAGYKNSGQDLKDWMSIKQSGRKIKIHSARNEGWSGWQALKKLAKAFTGGFNVDTESDLTMIIEVPDKHQFKNIEINSVASDVYAKGLKFVELEIASVSGQLILEKAEGRKIELEAVSGNAKLEVSGLKSLEFESVSGNLELTSIDSTPSVEFNSVSGNMELQLPSKSEVEVSFESMTGNLTNEFGGAKSEGNGEVEFSSLSGNAKIQKIKSI